MIVGLLSTALFQYLKCQDQRVSKNGRSTFIFCSSWNLWGGQFFTFSLTKGAERAPAPVSYATVQSMISITNGSNTKTNICECSGRSGSGHVMGSTFLWLLHYLQIIMQSMLLIKIWHSSLADKQVQKRENEFNKKWRLSKTFSSKINLFLGH